MLNIRLIAIPTLLGLCLTLFGTGASADEKTTEVKIKAIKLTVPKGWKQKPPSNRLRLAQFDVPQAEGDKEPAEIVVYSFGGGGGGNDANIARWIGQFAADGRKAAVTKGKASQGEYIFVDVSGTYNKPIGPPIRRQTQPSPGYRMLAVILTIPGEGNYFLKMTGQKKTVDAAENTLRNAFGGKKDGESKYEGGI